MKSMLSNFSLSKPPAETRVVVGMSGGVDSSVCAALLKEAGFDVIGLFMRNWDEQDENGVCLATKDYQDVISVCEKLDIPYYSVDFVEEYWNNVFEEFLREYKLGHTPNPDILCNREIKFKVFYERAMEMGADFLATGHYCQTDGKSLLKGVDGNKDQSYFLYAINGDVLKKVMFPIGHLEKPEVRKIAEKYDLATKAKKDSTGICFIGERNFKNFLSNYVQAQSGEFQTLDGKKVGTHSGMAYYTVGQRKGLGLGGPGEPWFVVAKDAEKNIVFVERGENHPALFAETLVANELTWIDGAPTEFPYTCKAKIRYRQKDQNCVIESLDNGLAKIRFPDPQRAITKRQSVVFYDGEKCLGGGIIQEVGPSLLEKP